MHFTHISWDDQHVSASRPEVQHFVVASRRAQLEAILSHTFIPKLDFTNIFPLYTARDVDFILFWEIPPERRAGHIIIPGLTLGAGEGALNEVLDNAESIARIMFAETTRERDVTLEVLKASTWNEETDPVILGVQAPEKVEHDFAKGPCVLVINFNLYNQSTLPIDYTLELSSAPNHPPPEGTLPPTYFGKLKHYGTLQGTTSGTIQAKMIVPRSGNYALTGWAFKTTIKPEFATKRVWNQNPGLDAEIVEVRNVPTLI
jgi:hypothetical protein